MDGKTPESMFTWTDDGNFYGTAQGVSSPYDLVNLISSNEPEAQPEPQVDHATHRAEAAEQHLAVLAQSLTDAQASKEKHREAIGLIRFKAAEALQSPDLKKIDWQALIELIISIANEVLADKA